MSTQTKNYMNQYYYNSLKPRLKKNSDVVTLNNLQLPFG